MVDLTTSYLGLQLRNPVVASSSPLTQKVENVKKLEEAGIAAVVMHSLFEEQIIHESLRMDRDFSRGVDSYAEALSYLPEVGQYSIGPETYIDRLRSIKEAVNIPVFGSLNGVSTGGWIEYAQKIEQAGADALELNLYNIATDPNISCMDLEKNYVTLVENIRSMIKIPIAVKLSPFFTALPNFAMRLAETGINGLVLFNRFYQPDFDLEELEVVPNLVLSNSNDMRLPLRWIAILYKRINVDFALTSGVHSGEDVIKAIMAGASVTSITSEFLQNGIERVGSILAEMYAWMEEKEYESVTQMKGSMSQKAIADPAAFERVNYMKVLSSY